MDWIIGFWRDYCIAQHAFWRQGSFWLVAAAVLLPFGWVLLAFRLQPVRIRYFRRRDS